MDLVQKDGRAVKSKIHISKVVLLYSQTYRLFGDGDERHSGSRRFRHGHLKELIEQSKGFTVPS